MLHTNGHKPVASLKSSGSSEKQQSEIADFTAFPKVSVANRCTNYFEVNDEVNDFFVPILPKSSAHSPSLLYFNKVNTQIASGTDSYMTLVVRHTLILFLARYTSVILSDSETVFLTLWSWS